MNAPNRRPIWVRIVIRLMVLTTAVAILVWIRGRKPESLPALRQPGLAPTPAQKESGPRKPQAWVIAIGIDQYNDPAIPACHGAVRDARAVANWFIKTAGWDESHVLKLDDLGQQTGDKNSWPPLELLPTRQNLDWIFKKWLPKEVQPDDPIVVFFAGQAVCRSDGEDSGRGDSDRQYLLPIDARSGRWDETGWRIEDAIDGLASMGSNPIVCWLDTSLQGRGKPVPGSSAVLGATDQWLQRIARWPDVAAWLAAEGRPALEAKTASALSPFTAALLESLGSERKPNNLLAALSRLGREPRVTDQGFRTFGGVAPDLSLWPERIQRASIAKRELLLQRGHAGAITAITFTADGRRMITGAHDSTVKVWDAAERRVLRALPYHMVGVTSLALSPDGQRLVSGDGAGWLRVWDLVRQQEVPTGPPHERGVDHVVFLASGERFLTLDMDGKATLWDTANPSGQVKPLSPNATAVTCAPTEGAIGFALAEIDGKLQVFAPDGSALAALDGPGGPVIARRLATNGQVLAAGDDVGRVIVWEARSKSVICRNNFGAAIDAVTLSTSGCLAVASGKAVHPLVFEDGKPTTKAPLSLPGPANHLRFSADGRFLAASTADGSLRLWRVNGDTGFEPVPLEHAEKSGRSTALEFSPDGRRLVSGDQDGGLRTWDLPSGGQRPAVPPRRGQVAGLSVSYDGRYLLQVTQDRQAQVWDLKDGRGLAVLDGRWTSGVLSGDGETVFLTSQRTGDVVSVDRETGRPRAARFERPDAQGGPGPARDHFGRLALSPDGRWVAAGSVGGPLVCVWSTEGGRPVQTLRGHVAPHAITAMSFSSDSHTLLTASEDGSAKLWELGQQSKPARELARYAMTDEKFGEPLPIGAAAMSAGSARRVVTGGIDGRVMLWEAGKAKPVELGRLERSVLAATFTPDGRWLAVAGADKSVALWDLSDAPRRVRLEPSPQHSEQVNCLLAWPGNGLFASGSDDTTIRLWSLAEKRLLGTLSAEQGTTDWVAYTPDGLFDSSVGGEKQVTWLDNREVLSLEQVYDQFHVYKLTDALRKGNHPKAPELPREPPPRLSLEAPARRVVDQPEVGLTIALGEPGLSNVRLYQNGVPVQAEEDLAATSEGKTLTTRVRLRPGLNRFYVMGGRKGVEGIEGRSQVVEIGYEGPEQPGRLHVLALGVSKYKDPAHALQFADRDAKQLADFLHQRGLRDASSPGLKLVLADEDVTEDRVDDAFRRLRDAVKGHPEDTVVVFLAGHADVLNDRFYLLLTKFPFEAVDPKTGRPRVSKIDPGAVLPYVALYRNIARLGALKRLVVVDACQAEAIGDDPGVRQIQQLVDSGAQRARTAYLLGARRGEPAGEVAALEHGLMTYALLKGMGAPGLERVPGLTVLDDPPDADRDRNGVVTTGELRWYTDVTVPKLASTFPTLVMRTGAGRPEKVRPSANLDQRPKLQASDVSFPLVALPREAEAKTRSTGGGR